VQWKWKSHLLKHEKVKFSDLKQFVNKKN